MGQTKNILFIMFDQLRWDYLSCYGHPHLKTPNIDKLAAKGVRFDRATVQSPICGSSRMSTYTGRYVQSHGASWNNIPLKVGELTMGDHLRDAGMGCWLVGKTHMKADAKGMARLGLEPDSVIGARVAECGFDLFERNDGMMPEGPDGPYDKNGAKDYNKYLKSKGYNGENPWHDHANSGIDDAGNVLSGWFLKNSEMPANIAEYDSETPYLTRRGMAFIEQASEPWCCHLSYIKPHWPYVVPAPYHDMYSRQHFLPPVRSQDEFDNAHPVMRAFMESGVSRAFAKDHVRDAVLGAYMGLIKQCDDQIGVLFDWLEETGRMQDTMIVITSDHGDFLGDHWMGEKMFFQNASVRVPLIIYDPSPKADATRGTVCDALVESIDLLPTFIDVAGAPVPDHIVEGHSLLPILHGTKSETPREFSICEYDYSVSPIADRLGLDTRQAAMFMVATKEWKLIHFEGDFLPMLFDLTADPDELVDLGESPDYGPVIAEMYEHLFKWARRTSQRTTSSDADLLDRRRFEKRDGVILGVYDEKDISLDLTSKYRNKTTRDMRTPK